MVSPDGAENGAETATRRRGARQQEGADRALPRVGAVEALVERVRPGPAAAGVDGDRWDAAVHRRVGVARVLARSVMRSSTASVALRAARTIAGVSAVLPPGRSPTTVSAAPTWPGLFQRAFSAATASSTSDRNRVSSAASAALSADRRSTSNHASNGIALTDVPPPIRPTLNVVRGDVGTVRSADRGDGAARARGSGWRCRRRRSCARPARGR